ncbi:uncharacterized protein LOC109792697 [Cajanus cajan]|uniref:uncharacterized protein LOC109792697 n=1 Tax=Cajanus cajan TaxID=3821 RepID=UPI00098DBCF3|nr:uncharacterized protein LOC109792697 [Cajanus cajan]
MADRGRGRSRGGGRKAPRGRGHGGVGLHISSSESLLPTQRDPLPIVHEEPIPTFVDESIPNTHSRQDTPLTEECSLTPQYPPPPIPESGDSSDQRFWLSLKGKEFVLAKGPADVISGIFKQKFEGAWPTWKAVDESVRDMWFGEFQKEYKWDPQHDRAIRKTFEHKGSTLLKNAMHKVRLGVDKGNWIPENARAILDQHWASEKFQNKSNTAKGNRAVENGATAYTGGSISAGAHFEKLAKELNRPPTAWELVEKTKKLKTGEWVSDKARNIAEKYKEHLIEVKQQATQDDTDGSASTCISDNEVYLQVVKKNKKGNLYGLAGLTDDFIRSTLPQSSTSQPSAVTAGVIEEMQKRITKLNAELAAKEAKEKALEEHIRQHDEQMQYILRHFNIDPLRPTPPPPSTIPDDPDHGVDDALDDIAEDP